MRKTVYALLAPAVYHLWYIPQLKQDIRIWQKRSFIRYPKPIAIDAPLVAYRRWATQFYPAGKNAVLPGGKRPSAHGKTRPGQIDTGEYAHAEHPVHFMMSAGAAAKTPLPDQVEPDRNFLARSDQT